MSKYVAAVFICAALIFSGGKMALGKTVTLFSAFKGQLVDSSGAPQPGIEVTQWWRESPKDPGTSVTTTSDAEGRFTFDAVEESRFWSALLPGTPTIKQRITINRPDTGAELVLWLNVKTSNSPLSETSGKPLDFICRIDGEENDKGVAWGTCQFATP